MPLLEIRPARHTDIPALQHLIASSARALGRAYYDEAANEAAIARLYGVDTELIDDETYLLARWGGALAGCGGWSARPTTFGGDQYGERIAGRLDPTRDAARIRAFFVAPGFARRGVASALLARCEAAAAAAGFRRATMVATLSGEPFYAARGYHAGAQVQVTIEGVAITFVPMDKALLPSGHTEDFL